MKKSDISDAWHHASETLHICQFCVGQLALISRCDSVTETWQKFEFIFSFSSSVKWKKCGLKIPPSLFFLCVSLCSTEQQRRLGTQFFEHWSALVFRRSQGGSQRHL